MTGPKAVKIIYPAQDISSLSDADARIVLTETGILRDHLLFAARKTPRQEVAMGGRPSLLIGEVGGGDGLFVDAASGDVFTVGADGEWQVNATLRQFAESLELFEDSYPFYPANSPLEVREAAVSRLRAGLVAIDQTSVEEDPGFWNTILFDVGIGDYADETS